MADQRTDLPAKVGHIFMLAALFVARWNKQMTNISRYKLDTAFVPLEQFDHFAKPECFMEVSLWHNGEGFDVHLSSNGEQTIRLSWGQFKALKRLIKELNR